jgi:hypothetical protein
MKKHSTYIYIIISFFVLHLMNINIASAQGCVAIRSFSGCSAGTGGGAILKPGESIIGANFRYFQSFRHFRGNHEEVERVQNNTEVINDSYFLDLSMTYAFADRWFVTATLPFVYHERSSMYEHGGNQLRDRHYTYAQGLSDARLGAGYWLFSQEKNLKHNLAVGAGIKLPTGNYRAKGVFYNVGTEGAPDVRYVDQSIQPGDGGYGLTLEMQGYRQLSHTLVLAGNLFYLINPRETNGVSRSNNANSIMSVPDQYAARLGLSYISQIRGLDFYLGGRLEGIPVYDIIGGSGGFRRPGYVVSVEPGISYLHKNLLFNLNVPVSIIRNRTQSVPDKQRQRETGQVTHGDAAFADYLISAGVSMRFPGKNKHDMMMMEH